MRTRGDKLILFQVRMHFDTNNSRWFLLATRVRGALNPLETQKSKTWKSGPTCFNLFFGRGRFGSLDPLDETMDFSQFHEITAKEIKSLE